MCPRFLLFSLHQTQAYAFQSPVSRPVPPARHLISREVMSTLRNYHSPRVIFTARCYAPALIIIARQCRRSKYGMCGSPGSNLRFGARPRDPPKVNDPLPRKEIDRSIERGTRQVCRRSHRLGFHLFADHNADYARSLSNPVATHPLLPPPPPPLLRDSVRLDAACQIGATRARQIQAREKGKASP